jgi:hypothetical protein
MCSLILDFSGDHLITQGAAALDQWHGGAAHTGFWSTSAGWTRIGVVMIFDINEITSTNRSMVLRPAWTSQGISILHANPEEPCHLRMSVIRA